MNAGSKTTVSVSLDAVIVAVTEQTPKVLTVKSETNRPSALPCGPLDLERHATLERGLRSWVTSQTGFDVGYVEQLYTFGDLVRGGHQPNLTSRVISTAYLALVQEQQPPDASAAWQDWYQYLPWEDWRNGPPPAITEINAALDHWLLSSSSQKDRVDVCFGRSGAHWDPERTLERYELLFEAGLVEEADEAQTMRTGIPMAMDHRRIIATALGRLRGKIKYRPVVFELLPETFTLSDLQLVVEALAGSRLHKQNFRRLMARSGMVEATGRHEQSTGGRPAELFRFRKEVLRERPAPGVRWSIPHVG